MWNTGRSKRQAGDAAGARRDLDVAVETIRFLTGLLVQSWAILVAANAVLLGYGLAERLAGAFLAGAALAALTALASQRIFSSVAVLAFIAYRAERELGKPDGVVSSFAYMLSPQVEGAFHHAVQSRYRTAETRSRLLRSKNRPGRKLVALQAAVAIVEASLGVALWLWAGYEIF
jgi:hypothetical protein